MFQLLSREPELAQLLLHLVKLQTEYYRSSLQLLEATIPGLQASLSECGAQTGTHTCLVIGFNRYTRKRKGKQMHKEQVCALFKLIVPMFVSVLIVSVAIPD